MLRIFLLRHGESRGQTGESPGTPDPDLSARGEEQAQAVGAHLRRSGLAFDLALISPLTRAHRTFALAAPACARACFDSRLIECGWGVPAPAMTPPALGVEADVQDAWLWPDQERAASLIAFLDTRPGRRLLLVGSQGIFRCLVEIFLGLPGDPHRLLELHCENTSLSCLEINADGSHHLRYWNDYRHLAGLTGAVEPMI